MRHQPQLQPLRLRGEEDRGSSPAGLEKPPLETRRKERPDAESQTTSLARTARQTTRPRRLDATQPLEVSELPGGQAAPSRLSSLRILQGERSHRGRRGLGAVEPLVDDVPRPT